MDTFTTSYGRTLKCDPDFLAAHTVVSDDVSGTQPTQYDVSKKYVQKMEISDFIKDKLEYDLLMGFVESLGQGPWKNAIDVGGAEGTMAYLLKAEGLAEHASVLEIRDMRDTLTPAHFKKLELLLQGLKHIKHFNKKLQKKLFTSHMANFGYIPPKNSKFWKVPKYIYKAKVDDYIIGDFYEQSGKYDLITMFLCIQHFDVERLFAKVYDMLEEGGTYCFLVDSWWWPVNSSGIVGEFPYACQRLNKDDFKRYVETNAPNQAKSILTRYNYYHHGKQRPTIMDYIRLAEAAGLTLLGYRRLMPLEKTHPKTPVNTRAVEDFSDATLDDVLKDIHQFRSDVTKTDLQTAFTMAVFTKKSKKKQPMKEYLDNLNSTNYGYYNHPGKKLNRTKAFNPLMVRFYEFLRRM